MSVSEWTEGLKKKEASLIYVNPSVGFADSSPRGASHWRVGRVFAGRRKLYGT